MIRTTSTFNSTSLHRPRRVRLERKKHALVALLAALLISVTPIGAQNETESRATTATTEPTEPTEPAEPPAPSEPCEIIAPREGDTTIKGIAQADPDAMASMRIVIVHDDSTETAIPQRG